MAELQRLSAHLERAREEERTAIAREIHDQLGQSLTALKMDTIFVRDTLEADPNGALPTRNQQTSGPGYNRTEAIPVILLFFAGRRPDVPFRKVFLLFGAFILACGTTHLLAQRRGA